MKKNIKRYKVILCIIFTLVQIYIFKPNVSFAEGGKTLEDGTYVIKSAINNNYVLDVSEASKNNGANIQLYQNANVDQQRFKVKYLNNGYYSLTAVHSNKVLDVADAAKTSGTNVWQYGANNTDAQQWIIAKNSDGTYSIVSKCNQLYIDVSNGTAKNNANIQVYAGNGTAAQKFKFETVSNNHTSTVKPEKTISDGTYVIKSAINNNYVLDVSEASKNNGANIQLYQNANVDQQRFKVKYLNNGYYSLTAVHSNKVLDVAEGAKTNGANVWQYTLNNSDAQQWIIEKNSDGTYSIVSKCNKLYIDVSNGTAKNGSNIQVYSGNGTNAQKFKFESVSNSNNNNNNNNNVTVKPEKTIPDGTYVIKSVINNNYVLDVSAASKNDGANIQLYQNSNVSQQRFRVKYLNNGYYSLTAVHSNKVLDVADGAKTNGANVWQYTLNNSDAQQWIITKNSDGTYSIVSKCNNLYIDVSNGTAQNGSNIQVYTGNGTNAQKFKFEESNKVINIDTKKYPGYKEKIESLMDKHPNWNFELLYTGLNFDNVISGECALHSRNLVPSNYGGEWICSVCGTKLYDSGWYCTSTKAVAYYMDPRNFLDETNVFQFQDLNGYWIGGATLDGIQSQVNGTFLQNYARNIDNACRNQNVNPYYIITRMIQEQGRSGTSIGKGMNGGDGKTYYNPFNIGASGNGWDAIYANALATAKKYGWDSMEKAIEGGITFCKKNWLDNYQNTLYQNKFDIDTRNGSNLYEHQYMQNLMGAYSEARLMKDMYSNTNKVDSYFTFIIPVYENMSSTLSPLPQNNSEMSPINVQITANGGLNLRKEANENSQVLRTIGKGEIILSVQRGINSNWQKVITKDGTIGYMSGTYLKQVNDVTNCNYTARVTTNDGSGCYIRVGPSTRLDKLGGLPEGTSVKVINKGTYNNIDGFDWYRIQLSDGRQAFMPGKYLR